jgi:type IV secretory pathway TraG/TraD family ATPase VirD4
MKRFGLPSHDFNPVGRLPALAGQQSPELIDKAFADVLILLPEGPNASGDNKIFRSSARDLMAWVLIKLAIDEEGGGQPVCNIPMLKRVLGGAELTAFLQGMRDCDAYSGSVRRAGENFLVRLEQSSRFMSSVLAEAMAAMLYYDPASVLGQRTCFSDFDPRDLKSPGKPMSVYIIVPAEKANQYGGHVGLCLNALIDCCIEADRFEPRVTVVADEFAACGVLPSALPTLFLGRSRGVQLITYVQDVNSYSRYGEEASAFTTQAECVLAFSIRSVEDGENYSKRAGQRSVMTETTNSQWDYVATGAVSVGLAEKGEPILRSDEFLHLPDFTAALFYKQNPPLIVDLVSYRSVEGWREYVKPMPGAPPLKDLPIKYHA